MIRQKGAWDIWKILPRMFPYLRPYRRMVWWSVFLTIVAVLVGLAHPWPLAFMVDSVLSHHKPPGTITGLLGSSNQYVLLIFGATAGLVLAIVTNGLNVVHEYINTKIHQRIVFDLRSHLFEHAQRLSVSYHDKRPTGQLMTQINSEPEMGAELLMAILPLLQSAAMLVGMFVIAFQIDPTIALLSLTVVPFIYYSVGLYSTRILPRLMFVRGLEWQTASIVFESMSMMRVIAAFARERHVFGRFRAVGEQAVDARVQVTVRQTLFSLGVNTCTAAGTSLVLGIGALHVIHHRLTVGDLLVVLAYIAAVYTPLETISSTIGSMQQQLVALQGAIMLLDEVPEIVDAPGAKEIKRVRGDVAFEHVDFSYESRADTLKDIIFSVDAGQRIAIVGPTGAGKTTLMNLVKRFHDPDQGRVLIDGTDVRTVKQHSLREQISVVLQVPQLFSGTIGENIRYGRLAAGVEEIAEAARGANAHDFIQQLPDGYETELGEGGAQLSVGERQRICVARAFLKDAPILILDEPTSSIDSMTEAVILDALDRLMVGRTTFIIAHRLSTVRHADLILVMDQGRIVERGSHEELVERRGLYRQLHDAQMGSSAPGSPPLAINGQRPLAGAATNGARGAGRVGDTQLRAELERMLASSGNGSVDPDSVKTAAALLARAARDLRDEGAWEPLRSLSRLHSSPLLELRIAAEVAHALLYDLGLTGEHSGAATLDADGRDEIVRRLAPALRSSLSEVAR